MPIPKSIDDMPLTGEKVSTLQYLEARLHSLQELFQFQLESANLRAQQRFDAQSLALAAAAVASEKAINAELISAAEAVSKAEEANNKRFESMNEFRGQLADQASTFLPRAEASARFDSLSEKLDALSSRIDKAEGAGGGLQKGWLILVGAVGLVATVISSFVVLSK